MGGSGEVMVEGELVVERELVVNRTRDRVMCVAQCPEVGNCTMVG